jgi:hypothetical protein
MLPHLTRKQFPDRTWDAADLDAAAEFWLHLYEDTARRLRFDPALTHATELRLRGFPRADLPALTAELARRAGASDFVAPEVGPHDPDTLVLSSGRGPADEMPPAGLGLPLLAGPPFDGLVVEIRVRVVGRERKPFPRSNVEGTLVLVGEVRGGRLLLMGVWRSGAVGWEDETFWQAPWPDEAVWFAAFDKYRETGAVPAGLGRKLFLKPGADRFGGLVFRLLRMPLGKPRLGGLVVRVLVFLAVLAGSGVAVWKLAAGRFWPLAVVVGAWGTLVGFLFATFLRYEGWMLVRVFRDFRTRYARLAAGEARLVPLTRAEGDAAMADPWSRKYTADLEAAGFARLGDVRLTGSAAESVYRVFLVPDGVSYLMMLAMTRTHPEPDPGFRMWPAAVAFLVKTFLTDGGRVGTVASRAMGYRKKQTGPEVLTRVVAEADDPRELAAAHAEAGRRVLPQERFEQYFRRDEGLHEEERRLSADHPYTWGDHLRWYLQAVRKEYRG